MTTTPPTRLARKPAALQLTRDYDWRDDAVCRQEDPELFFPVGDSWEAREKTAEAKAVCGRCPSRTSCLEWALATDQRAGVWGGLSESERRVLARDRGGQYERCIDAQEWIEQQIQEGAKYREIARQLKVGHHAVCRAVKLFRGEREALDAAQGEEAAA